MFESPVEWGSVDDAGLLDMVTSSTRAEAVQAAARLEAIAELGERRNVDDDESEQRFWAIDVYEQVVAEVAAAAGLTNKGAAKLVSIAVALRRRLPKVAALYKRGDISSALVAAVAWRTDNVSDDAILLVDTALADAVVNWGPMSKDRTADAIDFWVEHFDSAAVRRSKSRTRDRGIEIGAPDDCAGVTGIWGALLSADAALVDKRLTEMAKGVCRDDSRSLRQRRADALGAVVAGLDRLPCDCAGPTCPAAGKPARANVVIHVLAEPAALLSAPDTGSDSDAAEPDESGERPEPVDPDNPDEPAEPAEPDERAEPAELRQPAAPADPVEPDQPATPAEPAEPVNTAGTGEPDEPDEPAKPTAPSPAGPRKPARSHEPSPSLRRSPALIVGRGIIPASQVADLVRQGATVRPLKPTDALLIPEPNYRPSRALADFVRLRDLTCRFPNCDVPADRCDLDHTQPWPQGPTHPSNIKCLCRRDHLLKTFCGWQDEQLPDGTVNWTSPSGQTYTTQPGSRLLFPSLCVDTGQLPPAPMTLVKRHTGINMPLRKRTRTTDRARRIATERAHRQREIAENGDPPF